MIEIIKDGITKGNVKITYSNTCPKCFCQYKYEESDTYVGLLGNSLVRCPCCGSENSAAVFPQTNQYSYTNMEIDQEGNVWNKNIK